jgi:NodT family efflux transporter outer membrane factor (OMF) lipoprotein
MPHKLRLSAASALIGLLAAGCTVGPDYVEPQVTLAQHYRNLPSGPAPGRPTADDARSWWSRFDDPLLTEVVERALARSLDVEAARARLVQSRATAKAAAAALLPTGQLQASASNQQLSLESPFGAVGSQVPGFQRNYDLYDLGPVASWEIDVFGGLRRTRQAAHAEAEAATDELAAVQVSVAAETADAYLQVRAFQQRLAVATRQEAVERELVGLLTRQHGEGVASDRELRQADAALEGVRATLPPLRAGEEAQLDRLDILMGAPAGAHRAEIAKVAPLPAPPALAGLGGPADLLRRRPDVLAAEQRLKAGNARIGAAIADYYPKLSLSGMLGLESLDTGRMFGPEALQHTVTGGLRWRLFDFGRVDAEVAAARGQEAEALAAYRQTVYRATGEVETALADLIQSQAQAAALARQIVQLGRARQEAEIAYEGGVVSLVEVLDADRDLLLASDRLESARAQAARAAVASFRATGGGWQG